ncbi:MAG: flagellar biosynthetic protein FliP, partial [Halanaerobium sp.]
MFKKLFLLALIVLLLFSFSFSVSAQDFNIPNISFEIGDGEAENQGDELVTSLQILLLLTIL